MDRLPGREETGVGGRNERRSETDMLPARQLQVAKGSWCSAPRWNLNYCWLPSLSTDGEGEDTAAFGSRAFGRSTHIGRALLLGAGPTLRRLWSLFWPAHAGPDPGTLCCVGSTKWQRATGSCCPGPPVRLANFELRIRRLTLRTIGIRVGVSPLPKAWVDALGGVLPQLAWMIAGGPIALLNRR